MFYFLFKFYFTLRIADQILLLRRHGIIILNSFDVNYNIKSSKYPKYKYECSPLEGLFRSLVNISFSV